MKTILLTTAIVAFQFSAFAQSAGEPTHFQLKGNFSISLSGGIAESFGSDKQGGRYFLINPKVGYHISDKLMVLAETLLYSATSSDQESGVKFKNASHYGVAFRYYTKKNLKCGTPYIQSGVYLFNDDAKNNSYDWLVTPGLILFNIKEKWLFDTSFDFQMDNILESSPYLMSAKIGVTFVL